MPTDYICGLFPILGTPMIILVQQEVPSSQNKNHQQLAGNPTIEIIWVVYGIALLTDFW